MSFAGAFGVLNHSECETYDPACKTERLVVL
jgi:hypothetical protein